jgi:glycerol-3-phosphate dehydrogenase
MVPQSAVAAVLNEVSISNESVLLHHIGTRSRIGKGSCQGTFCGLRIIALLYDQGIFKEDHGIANLRNFVNSRWKGQRPILFGEQLNQAELQEAIYCGLFGLEVPIKLKPAGSYQ